jgi:hypothetical protein
MGHVFMWWAKLKQRVHKASVQPDGDTALRLAASGLRVFPSHDMVAQLGMTLDDVQWRNMFFLKTKDHRSPET